MLDLSRELAELRKQGLQRSLRTMTGTDGREAVWRDRRLVNLASNNYLGLTAHPAVCEAAAEAARHAGAGSGASRLISGTLDLHTQLEEELARFKGTEAALVFPTGFMAAMGVITALCDRPRPILMDKLNHASMIDGARLAERMSPGTRLRTWPHGKLERLRRLLDKEESRGDEAERWGPPLVVTETVFSMDGDCADLPGLAALAGEYGATFMVDEAHATGVFGKTGRGLVEAQDVAQQVDVQFGTLSKAIGAMGGYVAGSRELIDYLVNRARSFIYTTALPPSTVAAARAALQVVQSDEGRRLRGQALANAALLRRLLAENDVACGGGESTIIPIILGQNDLTMAVAELLLQQGFMVGAVRPPTVAPGTARLRVSVTATHTEEDIAGFVRTLREALVTAGAVAGDGG